MNLDKSFGEEKTKMEQETDNITGIEIFKLDAWMVAFVCQVVEERYELNNELPADEGYYLFFSIQGKIKDRFVTFDKIKLEKLFIEFSFFVNDEHLERVFNELIEEDDEENEGAYLRRCNNVKELRKLLRKIRKRFREVLSGIVNLAIGEVIGNQLQIVVGHYDEE